MKTRVSLRRNRRRNKAKKCSTRRSKYAYKIKKRLDLLKSRGGEMYENSIEEIKIGSPLTARYEISSETSAGKVRYVFRNYLCSMKDVFLDKNTKIEVP